MPRTQSENAAATLGGVIVLALGIGTQNFPEGAAISIPWCREGIMPSDQTVLNLLKNFLPPGMPLSNMLLGLGLCLLLLFVLLGIVFIRLRLATGRAEEMSQALAESLQEIKTLRNQLTGREVQLARISALLESEKKTHSEKLQLLESAREELRLQFAELAGDIFDEKSSRFTELNRDHMTGLLHPFGEKLTTLKTEINEIYRQESRERLSLQHEILQLRETNMQMNQEAANLTRALKGDTKLQGDWGEMVLERILERSGLRRGKEFDIQTSFRDRAGSLKRPDVIVHLPEQRDIIIDSKVSLVNWERLLDCNTEEERNAFLRQLVDDVRRHITGLGEKKYAELPGLRTLDFVLLFIPIEPVFHAVFSADEKLANHAAERNIVVVSPTTLTATLKTVAHIWRAEQQNRNVLEIARRAGIMHDKFQSFVEDMEKIGRQLTTCRSSYDVALRKLVSGKNNLISQSKRIRELGVRASKELPEAIVELADSEDD